MGILILRVFFCFFKVDLINWFFCNSCSLRFNFLSIFIVVIFVVCVILKRICLRWGMILIGIWVLGFLVLWVFFCFSKVEVIFFIFFNVMVCFNFLLILIVFRLLVSVILKWLSLCRIWILIIVVVRWFLVLWIVFGFLEINF